MSPTGVLVYTAGATVWCSGEAYERCIELTGFSQWAA